MLVPVSLESCTIRNCILTAERSWRMCSFPWGWAGLTERCTCLPLSEAHSASRSLSSSPCWDLAFAPSCACLCSHHSQLSVHPESNKCHSKAFNSSRKGSASLLNLKESWMLHTAGLTTHPQINQSIYSSINKAWNSFGKKNMQVKLKTDAKTFFTWLNFVSLGNKSGWSRGSEADWRHYLDSLLAWETSVLQDARNTWARHLTVLKLNISKSAAFQNYYKWKELFFFLITLTWRLQVFRISK